jgi:DNA mismatch repair protein MSH5
MNGIDASVVARANKIAELLARGENLVATCAGISQTELEELEDAVRVQGKHLNGGRLKHGKR